MNKYILIILVSIGLLGLGGILLMTRQSGMADMTKTMPTAEVSIVQMEESTLPQNDSTSEGAMGEEGSTASPRYAPYSENAFRASADMRRVLFFYASWCPTCRPADADFTDNMSQIPEDVVVFRVNYNDTDTDQDEKDLAEQYGITYQHTFVQIDEQGQVIKKWNGGKLNELLSNIQKL